MEVFRNLDAIPRSFGPSVASIGNFDGVHRGHQLILDQIKKRAAALSARSVAVTFDPHPLEILRPQERPRLITPLKARLELLEAAGADAVLVLPFTAELACMRAREFTEVILRNALRAVEIHEGPNFRFGHRAEGGTGELIELGREFGFAVVIHPACHLRGFTVSSSLIRELIADGQMRTARLMLGYSFFVESTPAGGRGIGSTLTVPTINLASYTDLLPPKGVYVTRMSIDGEWFDAVTNVGDRPTFEPSFFAVETHLLNFHPVQLAPETQLKLVFYRKLREERQWPSPAVLREQILRDIEHAKRYLHLRRVLERETATAGDLPSRQTPLRGDLFCS